MQPTITGGGGGGFPPAPSHACHWQKTDVAALFTTAHIARSGAAAQWGSESPSHVGEWQDSIVAGQFPSHVRACWKICDVAVVCVLPHRKTKAESFELHSVLQKSSGLFWSTDEQEKRIVVKSSPASQAAALLPASSGVLSWHLAAKSSNELRPV